MNPIFQLISDSYIERISSLLKRDDIWKATTEIFPTHLKYDILPSTLIARESGDLGLALLWLVQATLVQPLLNKFHNSDSSLIGALAHSEDAKAPVLLYEETNTITLNGVKKYITGGNEAEVIFVTCREPKEESINHLVLLKKEDLDSTSLKDLKLDALKTVSHGSLVLDSLTVPKERLLPMDGSLIKRHVKIWGMIERMMIMDAALGLVCYISHKMDITFNTKKLSEMLKDQLPIEIRAAESGGRVSIPLIDLQTFSQIIKDAAKCAGKSNDLTMNEIAKDLAFILKLG